MQKSFNDQKAEDWESNSADIAGILVDPGPEHRQTGIRGDGGMTRDGEEVTMAIIFSVLPDIPPKGFSS